MFYNFTVAYVDRHWILLLSYTRNSSGDEIPERDVFLTTTSYTFSRNVGWGTVAVPLNIMNTAGFYLLLLALFILTSILNANVLAQTISEINRKYGTEINSGGTARYTIYGYNVIFAAVDLVYINLQPKYELAS